MVIDHKGAPELTILLSQLVWQIEVKPMIQQDYLRLLVLREISPPEPCRQVKHVFKVAATPYHTTANKTGALIYLAGEVGSPDIVRVASWHHFVQSQHEPIRACSKQSMH